MERSRIEEAVRQRYAAVAEAPEGQFRYPVGRASAEWLGYPAGALDGIPEAVVERFVGVGNPFLLGLPPPGGRVVDVGCGAGLDSRVASWYVGPEGRVIGVDPSPEMLARATAGLPPGPASPSFREGRAEALPVEDGWADLVISNGVLNLAACKRSAFAEVGRVLRPGGRFQAADLVLVKALPPELANDEAAWST